MNTQLDDQSGSVDEHPDKAGLRYTWGRVAVPYEPRKEPHRGAGDPARGVVPRTAHLT